MIASCLYSECCVNPYYLLFPCLLNDAAVVKLQITRGQHCVPIKTENEPLSWLRKLLCHPVASGHWRRLEDVYVHGKFFAWEWHQPDAAVEGRRVPNHEELAPGWPGEPNSKDERQ